MHENSMKLSLCLLHGCWMLEWWRRNIFLELLKSRCHNQKIWRGKMDDDVVCVWCKDGACVCENAWAGRLAQSEGGSRSLVGWGLPFDGVMVKCGVVWCKKRERKSSSSLFVWWIINYTCDECDSCARITPVSNISFIDRSFSVSGQKFARIVPVSCSSLSHPYWADWE